MTQLHELPPAVQSERTGKPENISGCEFPEPLYTEEIYCSRCGRFLMKSTTGTSDLCHIISIKCPKCGRNLEIRFEKDRFLVVCPNGKNPPEDPAHASGNRARSYREKLSSSD